MNRVQAVVAIGRELWDALRRKRRATGLRVVVGRERPIAPKKEIPLMARIRAGKMIPFNLVPTPEGSKLERPARTSVEAPAELIEVSENGLTGFVGNRSSSDVSVKFACDADGINDNEESFNIHFEEQIDLVAADATGFAPGVFGGEVDIR